MKPSCFRSIVLGFGLLISPALTAQIGRFAPSTTSGSQDNLEAFQYRLPVNKTSNIKGPVPSNRWWSALLVRDEVKLMSAFPLAYASAINEYPAEGEGFGIAVGYRGAGNPTVRTDADSEVPAGTVRSIDTDVQSQFLVWNGSMEKASSKSRLHDFGDWHIVTETADNQGHKFYTTMAAGSPFTSFEFNNGQPRIRLNSFGGQIDIRDATGKSLDDGQSISSDRLRIRLLHPASAAVSFWGFFSAPGTQWTRKGEYLNLVIGGGANYLNTALLPSEDDFDLFYQHAYAKIVGTKASFSYKDAEANIVTDFTFTTQVQRSGFSGDVISAMFPHQYKHLSKGSADAGRAYPTLRGSMRLWVGSSFSTTLRNEGIILAFNKPSDSPGYSVDDHRQWAQWEDYVKNSWGVDTYGTGKALQRAGQSVLMTDAIDMPWLRDEIIDGMYKEFSEWFNADISTKPLFWADNQPYKFFSQFSPSDGHWGQIVGWRASYGSQSLNDIHFHYGYWVHAAAILAMYHPTFVKDYGWAIDLIIRNMADPLRGDKDFPYLRMFDPYAGRSYASGYYWFGFYNGNDQESTSEALNAWQAVYQWGQITGQKQYRDLGLYLYWTEQSAVDQYWLDIDRDVHHPDYPYPLVDVVREGNYEFATHWGSKQIEEFYGIQLLPLTPATLQIGRHRDYIKGLWKSMTDVNQKAKGVDFDTWHGTMLSFEALVDPQAAVDRFKFGETAGAVGEEYSPIQDHETWSLVYHFIHNMNQLGAPISGFHADSPSYAVFQKGEKKTFVGFNPSASKNLTIKFYDGNNALVHTIADIPPHKTIYAPE